MLVNPKSVLSARAALLWSIALFQPFFPSLQTFPVPRAAAGIFSSPCPSPRTGRDPREQVGSARRGSVLFRKKSVLTIAENHKRNGQVIECSYRIQPKGEGRRHMKISNNSVTTHVHERTDFGEFLAFSSTKYSLELSLNPAAELSLFLTLSLRASVG